MGILRFLLALNVVFFHTDEFIHLPHIDSFRAVCIFFIISGFYMALILNEKYVKQKKSFQLFITNRFLRIYPIYWIVLLAFISLSLIKLLLHVGTEDNAISHLLSYYSQFSPVVFYSAITNFFLRNVTLILTTDYVVNNSKVAGYLLVQQAWSLQLELIFYVLAPFLIWREKKTIAVVSILYLFARHIIFSNHLLNPNLLITDVFYYFIFFLAGIWSYHFYRHLRKRPFKKLFLVKVIVGAIMFMYLFIPLTTFFPATLHNLREVIFYGVMALSLPFFFLFSQMIKTKWDFWLGEISYPIYITHFIFIKFIANQGFLQGKPYWALLFVLSATFVASALLVKFVALPMNKIRQRRVTLV